MRVGLLLVLVGAWVAETAAQEMWTEETSGTTASLRGIAHGLGQFVAVGRGGIVLVSTDGRRWETRVSGTSADLCAIAHAAAHFVAVGEAGVVLVSRDAVVWRRVDVESGYGAQRPYVPRRLQAVAVRPMGWFGEMHPGPIVALGDAGAATSGHPMSVKWGGQTEATAESWRGLAFGTGHEVRVGATGLVAGNTGALQVIRAGVEFNAVTFAREQFVAVGRAGRTLRSNDGQAWLDAQAPTRATLLGVGFFNDAFIAVGEAGTILRSVDARQWAMAKMGGGPALRAVAGAEDIAVAVGDEGVILRSVLAQRAPEIVASPLAAETAAGGAAAFRVVAAGSAPLAYQWFKDGRPVSGATEQALMLDRVAMDDAGAYHVRVTNAAGTVTSAAVALTVAAGARTPIVDEGFRADPTLLGHPLAMLPLADGGVVVAMRDFVDQVPLLEARPRSYVIRLRADGTIDAGFRRGFPVMDEFEQRPNFNAPVVTQLLGLADGRILAVGRFIAYNGVARAGLVRLFADGAVDESFTAPADVFDAREGALAAKAALQRDGKIVVQTPARQIIRLLQEGERDPTFVAEQPVRGLTNAFAIGADGRIFIGTYSIEGRRESVVAALLPDGANDPSFVPFMSDPVVKLHALPDGKVIVGTRFDRGPYAGWPPNPGPRFVFSTFRLQADGALDPMFAVQPVELTAPPAANGDVLVGNRFFSADGGEVAVNLGVRASNPTAAVLEPGGRLWIGGDFEVYHGVRTPRVARLNVVASENTMVPRILAAWAERPVVRIRETVTLRVAAIGPGPLTYEWRTGSSPSWEVTAEPWHAFTPDSVAQSGEFSVRVRNAAGEATSLRGSVTIVPGELRIVSQPRRVSLMEGREGRIAFELAPGSAPQWGEWYRDGMPVATMSFGGALDGGLSYLTFARVERAHAGVYTARLTDLHGATLTTEPIVVTVGDASRFVNLSTRAQVGAGDKVAILGFTVREGWPVRRVQVRGIGPALERFGVTDALQRPRLDVFDEQGRVIGRSNGWEKSIFAPEQDALFERVGAFPLERGAVDTALLLDLQPGSYTARLAGLDGAIGEGLIELYEDDNRSERITNMSSRVFVGDGESGAAIAGFAVVGPVSKRVLLRASGPALTGFGVAGALVDPWFEVRAADGRVVAGNDDWGIVTGRSGAMEAGTVEELSRLMADVGAFPFASASKDAALVVTLPPGIYSLVARGSESGGGVALLEIYEVDE